MNPNITPHVGGLDEETQTLIEHWRERCAKAGLTEDQTEQVVDFRTDPWWCNADSQADTIIEFFKRQNDQLFDLELGTLHHQCGPLCPECGDPRDTSVSR